MILNRNGIPINRWKSITVADKENKNVFYEFSLPPGTIKKFELDKHINAFAIVQSFGQDYLYVAGNPINVNKQIRKICGKRLKYSCTTIAERKGA